MVARSQSTRLAVMTHQFALRLDEAKMATSLSQFLGDPVRWRMRLNVLARANITEDDLAHWIWILDAEDSDTKVQRLVSANRFKPTFVLLAILRTDEYFREGSSLVKLYDYIMRVYTGPTPEFWRQVPRAATPRAFDSRLNMSPKHFTVLIQRLLHHCLRTFPSSIVMIARLVIDYIGGIPNSSPNKSTQRTGYTDCCSVFNYALQSFRQTSARSPLAQMRHNWKAQKILLGFSAGLKRPLIINKLSFRAIRIVLLGLKKSEPEKMAAVRYTKSWPPYIRQLDGTDEARDHQDYFSRSVKAGVLKRSEGYADELADHTLDTLGGVVIGESVTIQTRSTPLGLWTSQYRSLRIFTDWAAKVKATRNAQEAWQKFHEAPQPGLKPNFQVYAEMFSKIFSAETDLSSSILPGDARETFPTEQPNLTELERARLRPCSAEMLYEQMLRDGNRPVHQCLALLIRNAPTLADAARFLKDSPLDRKAVEDLTTSSDPLYKNLTRIPVAVFTSYVALLCSQQGRRRWVSNANHEPRVEVLLRYDRLKRAVKLVCKRLGPRRKPAAAPWHTVMRALARRSLVLRPHVTQAADDIDSLKMMSQLFTAYSMSEGLHVVPFDCLARCTLKVVCHDLGDTQMALRAQRHTATALATLKSVFAKLTTPVRAPEGAVLAADSLPVLYHELSAANIQTYLELLAEVGDADEGVRVVEWVLDTWKWGDVLGNARDREHKQWSMLRQAFVCFRAFAESKVSAETMEKIERRFMELEEQGGTWEWPREEDVEEYRRAVEEKENM